MVQSEVKQNVLHAVVREAVLGEPIQTGVVHREMDRDVLKSRVRVFLLVFLSFGTAQRP